MNKIMIAPDSFKGTLTATQVCEIMTAAVKDSCNAEVIAIPIADGGEGTIESFGAKKVYYNVTGPNGKKIESYFGVVNGVVVVEMAACAGFTLADVKNPEITTTYGVGELISIALNLGHREFIVGLGGSATNDGGTGMAAALGVRFLNNDGNSFIPVGGTLVDIASIDISEINPLVRESKFTVMCDITNPLFGENGAAYVFAPQKGADNTMVERLDIGLRHLSEIIKRDLGTDFSNLAGGGAAGGMGAGMYAFLGGELKSGIDTVLDSVKFNARLNGVDLILSGEGKFDSQSLNGKVVSGIANRIKGIDVPFVVIAGAVDDTVDFSDAGITAVFSIQRVPLPFDESKLRSEIDLYNTTRNVINILYKFR